MLGFQGSPGLGLNPDSCHGPWGCEPVPSHVWASMCACASAGLGIRYFQASRGSLVWKKSTGLAAIDLGSSSGLSICLPCGFANHPYPLEPQFPS